MTGSPAVIEALNAVYRHLKALEEQAHLEEHWLECAGWKCLSDWFDDLETNLHASLIHPLMKRVNMLGARLTPGYGFPIEEPMGADQIEASAGRALMRLNELHALFVAACNAAEAADDYETEMLVWDDWQKWTEKRIRKFEKRLGKIRTVGLRMFLQEKMD